MDAPPADLPDVAQAPPEKVVAYLRYLNFFLPCTQIQNRNF